MRRTMSMFYMLDKSDRPAGEVLLRRAFSRLLLNLKFPVRLNGESFLFFGKEGLMNRVYGSVGVLYVDKY